jgi:hypothetical protein
MRIPWNGRGAAALLALALGLTTFPTSAPLVDDADIAAEALAFGQHYSDVLQTRDPDAIRALYVDDGRFAWFSDGQRRYTSADEVLAGLEAMGEMEIDTTLSEGKALALGDERAWVSTSFQTEISMHGESVYAYGGVITMLLETSPEHGWQVLSGHTSTLKEQGGASGESGRKGWGGDK